MLTIAGGIIIAALVLQSLPLIIDCAILLLAVAALLLIAFVLLAAVGLSFGWTGIIILLLRGGWLGVLYGTQQDRRAKDQAQGQRLMEHNQVYTKELRIVLGCDDPPPPPSAWLHITDLTSRWRLRASLGC